MLSQFCFRRDVNQRESDSSRNVPVKGGEHLRKTTAEFIWFGFAIAFSDCEWKFRGAANKTHAVPAGLMRFSTRVSPGTAVPGFHLPPLKGACAFLRSKYRRTGSETSIMN